MAEFEGDGRPRPLCGKAAGHGRAKWNKPYQTTTAKRNRPPPQALAKAAGVSVPLATQANATTGEIGRYKMAAVTSPGE